MKSSIFSIQLRIFPQNFSFCKSSVISKNEENNNILLFDNCDCYFLRGSFVGTITMEKSLAFTMEF